MGANREVAWFCVCRLIGDSQLSYWFLAVECFLKKFLVSEFRQHPTEALEANLWLTKYVEELPHRGSKRAEPRPAMCTLYQVSAHMDVRRQRRSCSPDVADILQGSTAARGSPMSCFSGVCILLLFCCEIPGAGLQDALHSLSCSPARCCRTTPGRAVSKHTAERTDAGPSLSHFAGKKGVSTHPYRIISALRCRTTPGCASFGYTG